MMETGVAGPTTSDAGASGGGAGFYELHARYLLALQARLAGSRRGGDGSGGDGKGEGEGGGEGRAPSMEQVASAHLKVSAMYWGLTAMALLDKLPLCGPAEGVVKMVMACYDAASGGFGGNVGHDPHMLYTLSAVQILALYGRLDVLDVDRVVAYVAGLQNREDGSFAGDEWGEVDTRFSYCALNCCALLGRLDALDVDKACAFIGRCANFDGGFGSEPGAETHGGQVFTCVAALAIAGKLEDHVDANVLGFWLAERQLPGGGLNGRPEKLPDVCYSWWILSSLKILGRLHWIDKDSLRKFILACQDEDDGGIADRVGDRADVFHTFFGLAGLSFLGDRGLQEVDPVYALPKAVVDRLGLTSQLLPPPRRGSE